ncbi:MAG: hypothetical protein RR338_05345, partial [Clostridia bacterium]
RQGLEIELKPRKIFIEAIKMLGGAGDTYSFEIKCGGGTYIRSLARDIAYALGTVGYMTAIHRTKSGNFLIENAVTIDDFVSNPLQYVQPIEVALYGYPQFEVPTIFLAQVLNGVKIQFDNLPIADFFVVQYEGKTLGIGVNESQTLILKTRL